mmetsp:Transcript_7867/g.33098  ORF Transcript_7867/g.33098 Transcript_7867/m.33098 type:complete len:209 (-) Transcript_7867:550-1176(-)
MVVAFMLSMSLLAARKRSFSLASFSSLAIFSSRSFCSAIFFRSVSIAVWSIFSRCTTLFSRSCTSRSLSLFTSCCGSGRPLCGVGTCTAGMPPAGRTPIGVAAGVEVSVGPGVGVARGVAPGELLALARAAWSSLRRRTTSIWREATLVLTFSLTTALFFIILAREAKVRVARLSWKLDSSGFTVAMMEVLLLPPRESLRRYVSLESL